MVVINELSKGKWIKLGLLAGLALLIWVFGMFPELVERYYTYGIYPGISLFLRMVTRWIPFSLGDVFYAIIVIWLIISVILWIIQIFRTRFARRSLLVKTFYLVIRFTLWAYILFKLLWGLNYNRLGIAYQLGIDKKTYTKEEIIGLTNRLIAKVNECRRQIPDSVLPEMPLDSIYIEAFRSYQTASLTYDFMNYRNRSVKASLFSKLGSYFGFTGYFNPFTGEAQVRSDIPRVLVPYVTCHEMAHQLGYGSESEANFVGYLAASVSTNPYFRYSVYLDLFSYAQGEEAAMFIHERKFTQLDSLLLDNLRQLDSVVQKERKVLNNRFFKWPMVNWRNRKPPQDSTVSNKWLIIRDSLYADSVKMVNLSPAEKDSVLEQQRKMIRSLIDEMFGLDSVFKHNRKMMDSLVNKDRQAIRDFFTRKNNRIAPAVSNIYDQYLKINSQSEGIKSYDQVIGWLIAYEKKYGKL